MSHINAERSDSHLDHSGAMPGPRRGAAWVALLWALAALVSGCAPEARPPRARSVAALISEKIPVLSATQGNVSDDRRRFKDAPVYIDGRRVGVIRPLEVPASLKPRMRIRAGATPTPRYSIAEYITAAGGDLAKVREVHLYGGRTRIAIVSGDEVRKHREDLFFLFTGGTRGKPRIGWPPDGIKVNASIDIVVAVAVYQEKEPPEFDRKKGELHFADGKPIEGIPYAPDEELKGTRFYVDGVLAAWMKRKVLPNAVLAPGADLASGLFSLRAYIESIGVDPRKVKAIELVQGDDAVTGLDGGALFREPHIVFTLPRRSQGNIMLWLPSGAFSPPAPALPKGVPVRVSAVQLFLKIAPPKRTYAKVQDLIENEEEKKEQPGSKKNQDDSEN
jgi:hypothetical protein